MSSPTTPSRALLRRFQSFNKNRVFRVAIIGQDGVGKSALTVRFLTRRFIGDYDPTLEKMYACTKCVMGQSVDFEILDTAAGQYDNNKLKQHIKWCDAVILMYSVTDRCSFNECRRLNFTITASIRRRYKGGSDPGQELPMLISTPVSLVGNMSDRDQDRMVSAQEGREMATELSCVSFTEISVREDIEPALEVFEDLFITYRKLKSSGGSNGGSLSLLHPHHPHHHPNSAWLSLDRLAFGHSPYSSRERLDTTAGGGVEEEDEGGEGRKGRGGGGAAPLSPVSPLGGPPPSPGFRTRRREALVA